MKKRTLSERVDDWIAFATANSIKLNKILIHPDDAQEANTIRGYGLPIKVLGYSGEE